MNSPKPFSLPEYSRALVKFVHEGVGRLMEAKDEVWAMIPRAEPTETIPITQNTMPSGEVVQNNPVVMEAKFVISREDIRACNADELAVQLDSVAEQNLAVVMPHFFDILARTSQAAGTAFDAGGRPFSFELLLESLENIEIEFDQDGNPEMPKLIVNPELAKRIRTLPALTPQQRQMHGDLIERKRKQFNARKRDRNLR